MTAKKYYKARPVSRRPTSTVTGLTYDSGLELDMHEGILSGFKHHPAKVGYIVPHVYSPDFSLEFTTMEVDSEDGSWFTNTKKEILVETKGFFQDAAEASKYKWIREHLDGNQELVFIFEKPNAKLPWSKKRKKCGTAMTHKEWADKNGFRAYGTDVTLEEILQ